MTQLRKLLEVRRLFVVYEDPDNSEVTEEFETFEEALKFRAKNGAEIIRNGVVLAAFRQGWKLTTEGVRLVKTNEEVDVKMASVLVRRALGPAVDNLERYLNSTDTKATKAGLTVVFGALAGVLDQLSQPIAAAAVRAASKDLRREETP